MTSLLGTGTRLLEPDPPELLEGVPLELLAPLEDGELLLGPLDDEPLPLGPLDDVEPLLDEVADDEEPDDEPLDDQEMLELHDDDPLDDPLEEPLEELEQLSQQQQPAWWLKAHGPSYRVSVEPDRQIETARV